MRVGFDISPLSLPRSGVGNYTANLREHLQAGLVNGHHLVDLTHHTPAKRLNKTLWMQTILPLQLSRLNIDVCHFTNNVGSLWTPCPSVLTIHDMTLWLFPEYHYRLRLLTMRPLIPIAARRAWAIITVSESTKRDIIRILNIPPEKVHVIYEAPSAYFQSRQPLPQTDSNMPEPFILYVGTIEPRKNLVRLLEAIALLHRAGMRHHLVMVGLRGWKDDAVFAAIERLGLSDVVHFLGYVPLEKLRDLYNRASVLAFPSLYEGFGLPVVEAMACGTPVVTSQCGALAEIAGDAAEFIEPQQVESIAQGLHHVLTDPNRGSELREKGLMHVSRYSWQDSAAQTWKIYEKARQ